MDGKQKDSRYERWLARAAASYERMFGGKSREELVTLTEREDMAVCLGKELAAFLLEEHVAADPAKVSWPRCAVQRFVVPAGESPAPVKVVPAYPFTVPE